MIGEKNKELLKLKGMKQTELANLTGIPKQTINSIITRNNKNVDFSAMEKIADVLGVPIEYFHDRCEKAANQPAGEDGLTRKEEFIDLYSSLPEDAREVVLSLMRVLAKRV